MFEKKEKKDNSIPGEELLERITIYSKRKYATKIYIPEFNSFFNINSLGVVTFITNDDLFEVYEESDLKRDFDNNKIKLYREKKDENL